MKILHTSDLHLGASLRNKKRDGEFKQLLQWLIETIKNENIDLLLIAGDIFDTYVPSNNSRKLYYHFLKDIISKTNCQNVVITAGNHDSPTFLKAPKELLSMLNIHIVAEVTDSLEDEIIEINDSKNNLQAIVAAVPFLKNNYVMKADKNDYSYNDGVAEHYQNIYSIIKDKYQNQIDNVPVIAICHNTIDGKKIMRTGDEAKLNIIGGLEAINQKDTFGDNWDYIALGHIHIPQMINNNQFIRYSGSPIKVSFSEAEDVKSVVVLNTENKNIHTKLIEIPIFQQLKCIEGNYKEIEEQLNELIKEDTSYWLDIAYTDEKHIPNLSSKIDKLIEDSKIIYLRIKDVNAQQKLLSANEQVKDITTLDEESIFEMILNEMNIVENKAEYKEMFAEILQSVKLKEEK